VSTYLLCLLTALPVPALGESAPTPRPPAPVAATFADAVYAPVPVLPEFEQLSLQFAPESEPDADANADRSIIRGQSTQYDEEPPAANSQIFSPGMILQPFAAAPPAYGYDPFNGQPPPPAPMYYDPYNSFGFGVYPPQPFRCGWSIRADAGFITRENLSGVFPGSMQINEYNIAGRYSAPISPGIIFSWTPEANIRTWSGPSSIPLPGSAYRFASDFELVFRNESPWSVQIGFTPQIGTDLKDNLDSNSYFWDGRGILFYRASPTFLIALGAAYWNRAHDRVIPYAGFVWTPTDRLEFNIMFPQSRISYNLGMLGNRGYWIYGTGGYNIEAYNIQLQGFGKDRIQFADYRLMLGLRSEGPRMAAFIEGGWVLDRQVDFSYLIPGFTIGNGYMARVGVRF
jgi:hypothetical protein